MPHEKMTSSTKLVKNKKYSPTVLPDGSWILFDGVKNEVTVLSATAGIFWELCSGELFLESVIQEISHIYPQQSVEDIHSEVFDIAAMFIERGLLIVQ